MPINVVPSLERPRNFRATPIGATSFLSTNTFMATTALESAPAIKRDGPASWPNYFSRAGNDLECGDLSPPFESADESLHSKFTCKESLRIPTHDCSANPETGI